MSNYKEVELLAWEKELIIEHAFLVILDKQTKSDLNKSGDGVVRFTTFDIDQVTAELCHACRNTRSRRLLDELDEVSNYLEGFL